MSSSSDSNRIDFVEEEFSTASMGGGLGPSYAVTAPESSDSSRMGVGPSVSPSMTTYSLDSAIGSRPQTPRMPKDRTRRPWTTRTLLEELGALSTRALLHSPQPADKATTSSSTADDSASGGIQLAAGAHTDDDFDAASSPVPTDMLTDYATSECRSPSYSRLGDERDKMTSPAGSHAGAEGLVYTDFTSTRTTQASDTATEYTEPDSLFEPYTAEFVEKLRTLDEKLSTDALACDAKWSLFVAAAMSYRYGSQLQPFPPEYRLPDGSCNIEALLQVINDTPKLANVLYCLKRGQMLDISTDVLGLLHFVLVQCDNVRLRTLGEAEYHDLLLQLGQRIDLAVCPTNVFEVLRNDGLPRGANVSYGFHGNKLDTFYASLQNGFPASELGRTNFVTKRLQDALSCSAHEPSWGASACGPLVACVGLCECSAAPSGQQQARLRYLLFYGCSLPADTYEEPLPMGLYNTQPSRRRSRKADDSSSPNWFKRNRYTLTLVGYTMMFTSIALLNGSAKQLCQRMCRRAVVEVSEMCKHVVQSA